MSNDAWKQRHREAWMAPRAGHESALVRMISGWQQYAKAHHARYESDIGDDLVIGPHWKDIGVALRGLLNGESGRLDCGTLDGLIIDAIKAAGFDEGDL